MSNCLENKPAPTAFSDSLNAINHLIPINEALDMIQNFANNREAMLDPSMRGNDTMPLYETFNLQAIHDLICQPTAIGFRIYPGLDTNQKVRFVLVGVDGDGQDILQRHAVDPTRVYLSEEFSNMVEESGQRWP